MNECSEISIRFVVNYTYIYILNYTCMITKLTLTIDETIISEAKLYAANQDRSLSDLVENYLKAMVLNSNQKKQDASSKVSSLRGVIKLKGKSNHKELVEKALSKKYQK